jgi:tetratricopeptide (TPR) repeat protein
MLGVLLGFVDANTTVILMSDHGFHPDHLRPGYVPAEPAGPAVEHRHFGILCMKGPTLRTGEPIYGASLLDICPTLLTLFGLPPARDMDGKVLLTAFKEPPRLEPIESWDTVPGDAGTHPPAMQLDPVVSAQAFKQLVELGYVAPPGANVEENVNECVRELKYNLARAYRDGNCCSEAAALADELWMRWPREHRFGILLLDCLGPLGQVARRRAAVEELGRRIELYQTEAKAELTRFEERKAREQGQEAAPAAADRRAQFEERQWRELAQGRPLLMEWLLASQAVLERRPAEARRYFKILAEADVLNASLSLGVASALAEFGDLEPAETLLQEALESDPENALVHAQLAGVYLKAGRLDEAIDAAAESLSLVYFQPGVHALLGRALMEADKFPEAERELLVAIAQSPRNLAAHELLGVLYRQHLHRPSDAFAHEGRALSLRHELAERQRAGASPAAANPRPQDVPQKTARLPAESDSIPVPFDPPVDAKRIITVVSGLPRSGTSMMMQLLTAAGLEPLTDSKRAADEDNPLGYFEFEKTLHLAKDASWLPEARGRVVKIVAQLLPFLPANEHYHILLMERNLDEVIASQNAMLARQGRRGAELDRQQLLDTYTAQLDRVRNQLSRRMHARILTVNFAALLADPSTGVDRVARFLGTPFDRRSAVETVHPELRRQRA